MPIESFAVRVEAMDRRHVHSSPLCVNQPSPFLTETLATGSTIHAFTILRSHTPETMRTIVAAELGSRNTMLRRVVVHGYGSKVLL
jgi:hypothetical protein